MNVKGYRASLNMRMDDTANYLGIARETYRRKEGKKVAFSLEEAFKLAKLFGITIEEFYEATKN